MDEFSRRPRQVDGDGAAKRRRLRRLRSWWRHEQQTVAAVLATYQHHSAPRGPRTARTVGGARDEPYGYAPEDVPPQAAGARYFAMDAGEDVGEAPAAGRPAPLLEVLPQDRVQQRVDPVPVVPLLHVFVPQKVEQLVDILSPLDFHVAEQVIEVPKIECPPRAARTVLRSSQTAEQLVEAPTIVSLVEVIEQPVDIPVRAWGGTGGRLQGFLPGQSSSSEEQIADTPVPRRGIYGGSQGFHPGQSSTAVAEQIVDIPVPHGSHIQDPGLASLPSEVAGEAFQGVFSTFLRRKKCEDRSALRVGTECGLYSIHAASSAAVHVTCHGQGDLGEW